MVANSPTEVQFTGDFDIFPTDVASFVTKGAACRLAPYPEGTADVVRTDLKITLSLNAGTYTLCLFQNNELKEMPHVEIMVSPRPPSR